MKKRNAQIAIALSAAMALTPAMSSIAADSTIAENGIAVESKEGEKAANAPKAYVVIDGQMKEIEQNKIYKDNISLKFSDDSGLKEYKLNDKMSPTSIGGTWADGNYGNINQYLNEGNGEDGKNTVTVWDKDGNKATYVFYLDQTAPSVKEVTYDPNNSTWSDSKKAIITTTEAIQPPDGWTEVSGSNGKQWEKTYTKETIESLTVTD